MKITREKWSELLNVELPECSCCGICCRCAIPSRPKETLLETRPNSSFTKDFFSLFEPYSSIEEAKTVCKEVVERSLKAIKDKDSIVFYKCKYLSDDNRCNVYEDRPDLCRVHPDNPYLLIPESCSFRKWSDECKKKHTRLKEELNRLKEYKNQLEELKSDKSFNVK